MNDATPDFDAKAFVSGAAEPKWDEDEIDLARHLWLNRDLHEALAATLEGTSPADARMVALHAAVLSCRSLRTVRDHLVKANVSLPDTTALVALLDDELREPPDKVIEVAQAVALRRLEAAAMAAGAAGDLATMLKAAAALEARKAVLVGGALFPLVPSLPKAETEIAPRPWVFGRHLIRGYASLTIAPGATGKSALAAVEALSMVTGRRLLHYGPRKPLRVWLWNLEDPLEELERRIAAIAKRFKITPEVVGDRLFLTGRELELKIAKIVRGGFEIDKALVAKVIATIHERQVDVLLLDPLVSSHSVSENDNMAMDAVVKTFAGIAGKTDCALGLSHHVRKSLAAGQNRELEVDDARGASSITDAVRSARKLQKMSEEEASTVNVKDRWRYFREVDGKPNLAPPAEASLWYKLESVDLINGDEDHDNDSVGVVVPWTYPTLTASLPHDIIEKVQAKVRAGGEGRYRDHHTSDEWVGNALGPLCHLDPNDKGQRQRLRRLIREWLDNGVLVQVERRSKARQWKGYVEAP